MTGGLRLNIGCGWDYRPGYLNIDSAAFSSADETGDALDLRFADNSADRIVAMQLIEHFDFVHCRYALAEWFRVLKPGGELVLETPDLQGSVRPLFSRSQDAEPMERWIFGIDSPGLQHKVGFTKRILQEMLGEAGFSEVIFSKPETYITSPGLRATCRKPADSREAQLTSTFRKSLRKALGTDDSFVLVPLEKWIAIARGDVAGQGDEVRRRTILSRLAVCNPALSTSLLEAASRMGIVNPEAAEVELEFLRWLQSIRFHQRAFALWARTRKEPGRGAEAFDALHTRLTDMVIKGFASPSTRVRDFEYLTSLAPMEIPALDWWLVLEEGQRYFSRAMKAHGGGDVDAALRSLEHSISVAPDNPLAYWNLARFIAASGKSVSRAEECYEAAERTCRNRDLSREIQREQDLLRLGHLSDIPRESRPR